MTDLNIGISRHFDPKEEAYDAIIIGAGMSGMAASIRLAMFDKKVLLLEKHTITGGLNSYYKRGKRDFDVGLHALTNFAAKGERRRPLTKLLKQLRIPYDAFDLCQQKKSLISFPEVSLEFSNELELLLSQIEEKFPNEKEGFLKLLTFIETFDEVSLDNPFLAAKEKVREFISEELLLEMIFCPLLIYGSAWEDDMDFSQFVIMFKSIFLEGFGRSQGGVKKIVSELIKKMEEVGVETCFRNGVEEIITKDQRAVAVKTTRGQIISAPLILSCAGFPETMAMVDSEVENFTTPRVGRMSFTETILMTKDTAPTLGLSDHTIIFENKRNKYQYRCPQELFDKQSAVICLPNNFAVDDYDEGVLRVTMMANYEHWNNLKQNAKDEYKAQKQNVLQESIEILKGHLPHLNSDQVLFSDVFTPTTVERYTGHFGGCVYGTPDKSRDGLTPIKGVILIGTDQGFLGIIGSMLSGISMANLYGLMGAPAQQNSSSSTNSSPVIS